MVFVSIKDFVRCTKTHPFCMYATKVDEHVYKSKHILQSTKVNHLIKRRVEWWMTTKERKEKKEVS